jgi:hypothetical protein
VFDVWVYGETNRLVVGSGLFVGKDGVAFNHHFPPRCGSPEFLFLAGTYRLEVLAGVVANAVR